MKKWTMYKVHRWIAVTVGGFFLVWLFSGIVMVLPSSLFSAPVRQQTPASFDFQTITISPAEAIASLEQSLDELPKVDSVGLIRIADKVVYEIVLAQGEARFIDVQSGQLFTMTPQIAERIVRDHISSQARVLPIELVTRHDFSYPWGPLPVYRITFENDLSTVYYVSKRNGTIQRSDRWSRIKGAIGSLHTFEPLKLITKRDVVRKGLLVVVSLFGVGAAASGFYLALLRRRS